MSYDKMIQNIITLFLLPSLLHSGLTLATGLFDLIFAVYNRYYNSEYTANSIGYSAHIGGAAAGFLIGMNILRNFHHKVYYKRDYKGPLIKYYLLVY